MKKFGILAVAVLSFAVLAGCQSKEEKAFEEMSDLQDQMMEVTQQIMNGEISEEEANEQMEDLSNDLRNAVPGTTNPDSLPKWAVKIGLTEPKNMEYDKDASEETMKSDSSTMFDSVTMVYHGDYETALEQAEKIADKAGISVSPSREMSVNAVQNAKEMAEQFGADTSEFDDMEEIGILYTNFEINYDEDEMPEYMVSIEVDEDGNLTIYAADRDQMKNVMDGYINFD